MKIKLLSLFTYCTVTIFASPAAASFSHFRTLSSQEGGWQEIELPNDLFKDVREDLGDLRIFSINENNDSIEEPYLIRHAKDVRELKELSFQEINRVENAKGYYCTFILDVEQPINEMELFFDRTNFDRKVTLQGSQNLKEWFTVEKDARVMSIRNDNISFKYTTISFNAAMYKYFRVYFPGKTDPLLRNVRLKKVSKTQGKARTIAVKSTKIQENQHSKSTLIELQLKGHQPIDKIDVTFSDTVDFYRSYTISALVDSFHTEKGWKYNYQTIKRGVFSSVNNSKITLPSAHCSRIRIEIFNNDNRPLALDNITVESFVYSLIARISGQGNLVMLYGNPSLSSPNYDIRHFKQDIPAQLPLLTVGAAVSIQKPGTVEVSSLFENENWLWVIMGIVILLIGAFTIKMLKGEVSQK